MIYDGTSSSLDVGLEEFYPSWLADCLVAHVGLKAVDCLGNKEETWGACEVFRSGRGGYSCLETHAFVLISRKVETSTISEGFRGHFVRRLSGPDDDDRGQISLNKKCLW